MTQLKLSYLGHIMRRQSSLEKAIMKNRREQEKRKTR